MTNVAARLERENRMHMVQTENTRLRRALRDMVAGRIEWLSTKRIRENGSYRVGLYDLAAIDGPSLITLYDSGMPNAQLLIRVSAAREWAEGILHKPEQPTASCRALRGLAQDVLIYLGTHKL